MKRLHVKHQVGSCLLLIIFCFFLLLSACGSDQSSSDDSSSSTGSIAFTAVWPDEASQKSQGSMRAIDCVETGVSTVNAKVLDSANIEVASQSWPCSKHQGTINDIPTGSGMSLLLEGLVSGTAEYSGSTITPFTVSDGNTTNLGEIPMRQTGTLFWNIDNWDEKKWG